ncbi:MAG: hypothetical protein JXQ93_02180, partial [Flavobacteriaceae bacterium]
TQAEVQAMITAVNASYCTGSATTIVDVVSTTGKTWMDRNLGATQQATSSADADAYGDIYQWGRLRDGHQCRTSGTTTTLSTTDTPGHGDFIVTSISPFDWRSPQNDNLWQGVSGVNNPCPSGYRLPTDPEWEDERTTDFTSNNAAGAFGGSLKLPLPGLRLFTTGALSQLGVRGYYWSSTTNGIYIRFLNFSSSGAGMVDGSRSTGYTVRCIKN